MNFKEFYKKLHIGLYLCFVLSIIAADYPLNLLELYSLIDSKNIKMIIEKLVRQEKDKLVKNNIKTFGLQINNQAKYELPLQSFDSGETSSTAFKYSKPLGNDIVDLNKSDFQISTQSGSVDVHISHRDNGSFLIAFSRNFIKKTVEKHPFLYIFNNKFLIITLLCLILFMYIRPIYSYNFWPGCEFGPLIEKKIIGLPMFIMALIFSYGLIKQIFNISCCYIVNGNVSIMLSALFIVSFIIYVAITSLFTMILTQEYINKYIAMPFFKNHEPHAIRGGKSINLSVKFAIIIFSIGVVPTAIGLYLPVAFNVGLMPDFDLLMNIFNNFDVLIPILMMAVFSGYFFILQFISMILVRKNLVIPVNHLISRMKLVAKGDFTCKTSVLYVDEIGQLKGHFNQMLDGLSERDKIKDTFGKFISYEIAEKLLKEKKINLTGEEIEATILFSDIRSFTTLSEKLEASELVEFLNLYFSHVVKPIHNRNGIVNKFIGDAVMAVFAPIFGNVNHEEAAVEAALEMKKALEEFNALKKYPVIKAGIGIHRGKLVAGNIGTQERMEYTFIGDNVNIASRIESETKNFKTDILISEDVINHIRKQNFDSIEFVKHGPVIMKGKSVPLELYGINQKNTIKF